MSSKTTTLNIERIDWYDHSGGDAGWEDFDTTPRKSCGMQITTVGGVIWESDHIVRIVFNMAHADDGLGIDPRISMCMNLLKSSIKSRKVIGTVEVGL